MDGYSIYVILLFMISGIFQQQYIPIIPQECEDHRYCESVLNYPHEYVTKIIDQLDSEGYDWRTPNVSYSNTQSNVDDQVVPLCKSMEKVLSIQAAKHRSGKWYFVINKWQKIVVRICVNAGDACGIDAGVDIELDSDANRTQCVQRYSEDYMLTIDVNGVVVERPLLSSAVCCSCAVMANKI